MSEDAKDSGARDEAAPLDADEYGGLSVEDDSEGTVNPADLAGTASAEDDEVGHHPEPGDADDEVE